MPSLTDDCLNTFLRALQAAIQEGGERAAPEYDCKRPQHGRVLWMAPWEGLGNA